MALYTPAALGGGGDLHTSADLVPVKSVIYLTWSPECAATESWKQGNSPANLCQNQGREESDEIDEIRLD